MKILVFGGKGYMGQEFLRLFPNAVAPSVDIADCNAVAEALDAQKPDVVINAAGKTGRPNIDWCEDHKEETVRANITGPLVLLDECAKRGIYWVHLGSGCVYQGDNGGKGFSEEDAPNFRGSFYSRTKAACDEILKEFPALPDGTGGVLILRLRMPFDGSLHERNLISKLSKYSRVLDTENSLTYLPDFFAAAKVLIERGKTGMYHVVNPGVMSLYRIMELYKEFVNPKHTFERLTLGELSQVTKAGRSNCVLTNAKLLSEGI
ncbi:hypothetical protein COU79_03850, partial [Candidatus Peregrinibacteria bacterium CG10_big_fil_rev_8_21_14_0_10_54_7]